MNWSSETFHDKFVNFMEKISKYKLYIVIAFVIMLIGIIFLVCNKANIDKIDKIDKYLELIGPETVILYEGERYEELGFRAYDKENNLYNDEVIVESNLNTNVAGKYQIVYKLGKKEVIRTVKVLKRVETYYKMILEKVNNEETVYLRINEEYKEPGYRIIDKSGNDVTDKVEVKITGEVDSSKEGFYTILYKFIDPSGETVTAKRNVVIIDNKLEVSIDKTEYTNENVTISIKVDDDYFDYVLMPNEAKIENREFKYKVEQNGIYKFVLYNKKGFNIERVIEINNIDKEKPVATCTSLVRNGNTTIKIDAKDNVGINKYIMGNKQYTTNEITINDYVKNVSVDVYDKAGNVTRVECGEQDKNTKMTLTPSETNYTKNNINIVVNVNSEYFDYLKLPNGNKVYKKNYTYTVQKNGKYTFTAYDKDGQKKEASIEINNIDKEAPTGECYIKKDNSGLYIEVKAKDNISLNNYVYNNKSYSNNIIRVSNTVTTAKVSIYDKANNKKEVTCKNLAIPKIDSITKDGVIIKVKASKASSNIKGYYFSYTNQRLNKNQGGYVATNKETIEVVRLVGTTYVWVEDESGNISEPKTITITNDALLRTGEGGYTVLQNKTLSTFLSEKGWSVEELEKLIARSVRASKMYTGQAAATAAVSLQTVLAQKYKIVLPYQSGGIYSTVLGVNPKWGGTSGYYGLDCSGFVSWTYTNAGYNFKNRPYYWAPGWSEYRLKFFDDKGNLNGEVGDILIFGYEQGNRHVKLIISTTSEGFITAESTNGAMIVSLHGFRDSNDYNPNYSAQYRILKSGIITEDEGNNAKYSLSEYPSGF